MIPPGAKWQQHFDEFQKLFQPAQPSAPEAPSAPSAPMAEQFSAMPQQQAPFEWSSDPGVTSTPGISTSGAPGWSGNGMGFAAPSAMAMSQMAGISPAVGRMGMGALGMMNPALGMGLGVANTAFNGINTVSNTGMLNSLGVNPSTASLLGGLLGFNGLAGTNSSAISAAIDNQYPGYMDVMPHTGGVDASTGGAWGGGWGDGSTGGSNPSGATTDSGYGYFKDGGYTGAGADGVVQPDRPAGTVHEGEYVVPAHVLRGLLGDDPTMDNPVGWSSVAPPDRMTNQTGPFDPVVGTWPGGKPMLRGDYEAVARGSINLFNSLANVAPSGPKVPSRAVVKRLGQAHNVPSAPPRRVADDYKSGVPIDASGRITHDMDGRPLTAPLIAGRSQMGSDRTFADRGLDPATVERVGTEAGGATFLEAPRSQLGRGRDVDGTLSWDPRRPWGNNDLTVRTARGLPQSLADNTRAHEVGHFIDEAAGKIDPSSLMNELKPLYSLLATGEKKSRNLTLPQHLGYRGDQPDRELLAEAIRTYMANPNFMKTVAPKTATRIREVVNTHPLLSKTVQFNALGGLLGLGMERRE